MVDRPGSNFRPMPVGFNPGGVMRRVPAPRPRGVPAGQAVALLAQRLSQLR
jgi:hypothetical protein